MYSGIFCIRWNGSNKASIFEGAIDDKEYNDNLISLLDNRVTFIKKGFNWVKWKKATTGRDDMLDYPEKVVFEAIVKEIEK